MEKASPGAPRSATQQRLCWPPLGCPSRLYRNVFGGRGGATWAPRAARFGNGQVRLRGEAWGEEFKRPCCARLVAGWSWRGEWGTRKTVGRDRGARDEGNCLNSGSALNFPKFWARNVVCIMCFNPLRNLSARREVAPHETIGGWRKEGELVRRGGARQAL